MGNGVVLNTEHQWRSCKWASRVTQSIGVGQKNSQRPIKTEAIFLKMHLSFGLYIVECHCLFRHPIFRFVFISTIYCFVHTKLESFLPWTLFISWKNRYAFAVKVFFRSIRSQKNISFIFDKCLSPGAMKRIFKINSNSHFMNKKENYLNI